MEVAHADADSTPRHADVPALPEYVAHAPEEDERTRALSALREAAAAMTPAARQCELVARLALKDYQFTKAERADETERLTEALRGVIETHLEALAPWRRDERRRA